MASFNFITLHLVDKITSTVVDRQKQLQHSGFLYFNDPITWGDKKINRISDENPFAREYIVPLNFYGLDGTTLVEIYKRLKHNEFYVYKKMHDGKDYKIRLKKK